jgi:hypothetical protein
MPEEFELAQAATKLHDHYCTRHCERRTQHVEQLQGLLKGVVLELFGEEVVNGEGGA